MDKKILTWDTLGRVLELLNKEKIKGYIGFDCTAESLHVGSYFK